MLTEKTNEIVKECKELMGFFMKEIGTDMFTDMDDEGLLAMKKCFNLMNLSMELAEEQAKVMDEINAKLDKLLDK